jgi:hypothetical protein
MFMFHEKIMYWKHDHESKYMMIWAWSMSMDMSEMHKILKNWGQALDAVNGMNDIMNDKSLEGVSYKLSLPLGKLHNVMYVHKMIS